MRVDRSDLATRIKQASDTDLFSKEVSVKCLEIVTSLTCLVTARAQRSLHGRLRCYTQTQAVFESFTVSDQGKARQSWGCSRKHPP